MAVVKMGDLVHWVDAQGETPAIVVSVTNEHLHHHPDGGLVSLQVFPKLDLGLIYVPRAIYGGHVKLPGTWHFPHED